MTKTIIFALTLSTCLSFSTPGHAQECTGENCPTYDDGYKWGQAKGYEDPQECGGTTEAFIEGCMAAAQRQQDLEMQRAAAEQQAHQEEQVSQPEPEQEQGWNDEDKEEGEED